MAVIGPLGNDKSVVLGNYLGQICPGNNTGDFSCVETMYDAIKRLNSKGNTWFAKVSQSPWPASTSLTNADTIADGRV